MCGKHNKARIKVVYRCMQMTEITQGIKKTVLQQRTKVRDKI